MMYYMNDEMSGKLITTHNISHNLETARFRV